MVRGYEDVKLANVAQFRTALAEAVRTLNEGADAVTWRSSSNWS